MRKNGMVITVDGPAGVGKTTVSKKISEKIGYTYIPTGFLYRAVAYYALQKKIAFTDIACIAETARDIDICIEKKKRVVFFNKVDITEAIQAEDIGRAASCVSQIQGVRDALFDIQRRLGDSGGVVMEGRDIGTVVFPDAEIKFFLTASLSERARRRYMELKQTDRTVSYTNILESIRERDEKDKTRSIAPLLKAKDAVLVDNTHLSVDDAVDFMIEIINKNLY